MQGRYYVDQFDHSFNVSSAAPLRSLAIQKNHQESSFKLIKVREFVTCVDPGYKILRGQLVDEVASVKNVNMLFTGSVKRTVAQSIHYSQLGFLPFQMVDR